MSAFNFILISGDHHNAEMVLRTINHCNALSFIRRSLVYFISTDNRTEFNLFRKKLNSLNVSYFLYYIKDRSGDKIIAHPKDEEELNAIKDILGLDQLMLSPEEELFI